MLFVLHSILGSLLLNYLCSITYNLYSKLIACWIILFYLLSSNLREKILVDCGVSLLPQYKLERGWAFTGTECQRSVPNASMEWVAFLGLLNSDGKWSWIVVLGFFCVLAYLCHQMLNSQGQGPYYICLSFLLLLHFHLPQNTQYSHVLIQSILARAL